MRKVPALAALAVLTGVAVSAASAAPTRVDTVPPAITVTTGANGTGYAAKALTAPANTQFLLVFRNLTVKQHNVSLEQGELEYGATLTIKQGSTASVFILKKGVYHFYSSVGNDENLGMSGTLSVK